MTKWFLVFNATQFVPNENKTSVAPSVKFIELRYGEHVPAFGGNQCCPKGHKGAVIEGVSLHRESQQREAAL